MKKVTNQEAKELAKTNASCVLLDVREPAEFDTEHVPGAKLIPLSSLETKIGDLNKHHTYLLMCGGGTRAGKAAEKLSALGFTDVRVVDGGFRGWKAAGLETRTGDSKVWAMERQVRMTAGLLVLLGAAGSFLIHPGFIWLSAFVGAGLAYSAASDTCTMALLLAKMPWNQKKSFCMSKN